MVAEVTIWVIAHPPSREIASPPAPDEKRQIAFPPDTPHTTRPRPPD